MGTVTRLQPGHERSAAATSLTVIGAGNGGLAIAGAAALEGWRVRVTDVNPGVVHELRGLRLAVEGCVSGDCELDRVSTDPGEVVPDSEIVAIVVPGPEQGAAARSIAEHLSDEQLVVVIPACTGGALEVAAVLRADGLKVPVGEIDSFPYACKRSGLTSTRIEAVKRSFRVACIPSSASEQFAAALDSLWPQMEPAAHVLETSLANMNAVLHVPPCLMNIGRIEQEGGEFDFYGDGITPAVARLVDAYDEERVRVAHALGVQVPPIREWIEATYAVREETLYGTIQRLHADVYGDAPAPRDLTDRYISEDVPCGAVPVASLATALGVVTPIHTSLIRLASMICAEDFASAGRTAERLGLAGLSVPEIHAKVLG